MSLRFVCIELRRNLRCANVFLQFDQSLTETEFLKINVDEDALRLREYSTETRVDVAEHFTIEARTMSNLTVEECNASFRLTIDNIKDPTKNQEQRQLTTTENKVPSSSTPLTQQLHPAIEQETATAVCCKNCECTLAAAQKYQRIREFPSGSIDMSEFFCHHGPDFGEVLVPHTHDLFYGFQFIVLNQQFLEKTTKEKETHLYCRRCLQYLGETLFNGKAAKLWADTLQFQDANTELCDIFSETQMASTCQLLHKIIYESSVSDASETLLQQVYFTKVLLEATFPNRQRKYLLLHILEKQLQVLKNAKPLAHGSHNNNNVLQVQLQCFNCFKLLYRVLGETEDEGGGEGVEGEGGEGDAEDKKEHTKKVSTPSMLDIWQKDISIYLLKVSPALFSNLLAELENNSLLIPELYRYTQDHFQLSYVFYD